MSSLKNVLEEPLLLRGFTDFCRVQHALENLEFWLAVEDFRTSSFHETTTPRPASSANLLLNLSSSSSRDVFVPPPSPSASRKSTRSTLLARFILPRSPSSLKARDTHTFLERAFFIFQEFLIPDAPRWVCHDQNESDRLKLKLRNNSQEDTTMFDELQRKIFLEMEKDLFPRFQQSFSRFQEECENEEESRGLFSSSKSPLNSSRNSMRFFPDPQLRASMTRLNVTPMPIVSSPIVIGKKLTSLSMTSPRTPSKLNMFKLDKELEGHIDQVVKEEGDEYDTVMATPS